jgi:hypothetical protein
MRVICEENLPCPRVFLYGLWSTPSQFKGYSERVSCKPIYLGQEGGSVGNHPYSPRSAPLDLLERSVSCIAHMFTFTLHTNCCGHPPFTFLTVIREL